ncbi:MAG: hypothetical protein NT004_16860 [Bacteroidetes bacterium]|nr:hypothetical protein [Bacteroidota bacterium]
MAKKNDMTVATLDLFNILRSKIGEREAQTLVEFVEHKVTQQVEGEVSGLATKDNIMSTNADINSAKADILTTKADIIKEIGTLEVKIEKTKAEIIKWMFIFWAGQTGIMVAILALFQK